MQGTIFNIQRFSIHDGPGIRTLIFMKGCPLRCRWCSNPEGLVSDITVLSNPHICIGCGFCVRQCEAKALFQQEDGSYQIDRTKCTNCLKCAKVCPSNSKTISGEQKTVEELLEIIKKDHSFYKHSGGGVTIGGGEMLAQAEFCHELLYRSKEMGIDTAIETSGCGSLEWLLKIAEQSNTIHYDIKAASTKLHKFLTGIDNHVILSNLKALSAHLTDMPQKPELIIRIPLINHYNTDPENIRGMAEFIKHELAYYTLIEVLAFHNYGEKKYEELGMVYEFKDYPNSTKADLEEPIRILQEYGLPIKVPKW